MPIISAKCPDCHTLEILEFVCGPMHLIAGTVVVRVEARCSNCGLLLDDIHANMRPVGAEIWMPKNCSELSSTTYKSRSGYSSAPLSQEKGRSIGEALLPSRQRKPSSRWNNLMPGKGIREQGSSVCSGYRSLRTTTLVPSGYR